MGKKVLGQDDHDVELCSGIFTTSETPGGRALSSLSLLLSIIGRILSMGALIG